MESFVIEGGRPLTGRVRAAGNKNGALPILAACLLTSEPVELANVPRIHDVHTMVELLDDIGASVEWHGQNELRVDAGPAHKVESVLLSATLDPNVWVDVGATIDTKVAALACHRTQLGGEGEEWLQSVIRGRAEDDGRAARVRYAEGFRRLNLS